MTIKKAIVVLVIIAGLGAIYAVRKKKASSPQDAVARAAVQRGMLEETVDATGEVAPLNRVEIKPPLSGRMEELRVDEGAYVKAGDVLGWMSSSDRAAILDAARAQGADELKRWQDAYKPTPVLAPLTGVVILRNVVVGQVVDPSTVLFAMSDQLIVVAQVDEADIARAKNNMQARITLDAYPDQPLAGRVFQILHEGKNVSNVITYGVKIKPLNVPAYFRSQMTANVNLIVQRKENVLFVPSSALNDNQVMIPDAKGRPVARRVEIGLQSGERTEIVSGLTEGEEVFVSRGRYVPQRAASGSPLVMGGSGRSPSASGGSRQRREDR